MKKTKQLFAGLTLMTLGLGAAQAEECLSKHTVGDVCLPKNFPAEPATQNYALNLMQGNTPVSHEIYDLHMLILWICVFIGIAVFGTMFYSIYHHRKSKGYQAAKFHENTTVEIIWTIIPTLILVGMAIPATKVLIDLHDVEKSDMTIKVVGHQWKWEYEYPENGIHFFSYLDDASNRARQPNSGIDPRSVPHYLLNVDKPLVIPTKKKIRFVFTAHDVIHSWWVPAMGWKKDANPGFVNEATTSIAEPGVFRGQCTELCGKDHAFMPIVVIAMEQADYDAWAKKTLDAQIALENDIPDEQSHDTLIAKGSAVYAKSCSTCHQEDGSGLAGAFPALTASKVVTGDINAQADLIINGKAAMPAFGKSLNAAELAQVITYTRNALGNKVGDEIQPKTIKGLLGTEASAPAKTETAPAKTEEKAVDLSKDELVAKGKEVYAKNCGSCHQETGAGTPPMFPALTDSAVVKGDINAQAKLVLGGKGMMPAFNSLSATEVAAVITYTRNALGNSVGDVLQASAVQSLQAGK